MAWVAARRRAQKRGRLEKARCVVVVYQAYFLATSAATVAFSQRPPLPPPAEPETRWPTDCRRSSG